MSSLLTHALDYAARSWPAFPLWWPQDGACACPQGGETCSSAGKHPLTAHGLDDASTDPATIRAWWQRWPTANVGLRTGVVFDVLDLDATDAGTWLARYAHDLGEDTAECWAWGPLSITAKGQHLLYAPTGAGNRTRVREVAGLDWRGRDGYIVAPPSVHASGHVYRWHGDCGPDSPIPPAPGFLVDLVLPAKPPSPTARPGGPITATRGAWSPSGLIARVATAAEGERNDVLNWAAHKIGGDVAAGKVAERVALEALEQLDLAAERAGLIRHEIEATIESGYRAGLRGVA